MRNTMHRLNLYIFISIISLHMLLLTACSPKTTQVSIEPAKLNHVEGSEFPHITHTENAAKRINVQESLVVDEQILKGQIVEGKVINDADTLTVMNNPDTVLVRVFIDEAKLNMVDTNHPARILFLDGHNRTLVLNANKFDKLEPKDCEFYYEVDDNGHFLDAERSLLVDLKTNAEMELRTVIPVGAVFYGLNGETWLYLTVEPLTYVRYPIEIDFIESDMAILTKSPPAGSTIVTVGGVELLGVEIGVGEGK